MDLNFDWMTAGQPQQSGAAGHDKDGTLAIFYTRAVPDKQASRLEGRAVFKNVPYVKIRIAGQENSEWDYPAKDADKARWPRAWAAYEAQQDGLADGTPLNQWGYLTPADVASLRAAGVYTVEQCSSLTDGALGKVGPRAREWRDRARQHLQGTSDTEKELRSKVDELTATVANLTRMLEAQQLRPVEAVGGVQLLVDDSGVVSGLVEPEVKRGPGRPRKVV